MTSTIESTFLAAVKAGPVLLLDNMGDRTHAATNDPLTSNSPLIRLAILAVDLGADPELLCFNKHQRLAGMTERQCSEVSAVMYNVGADCDDLTRALKYDVPTIGFHYCSLNAMYFVDEFGAYGQRLKAHRPKEDNENVQVPLVWFEPMPARVDFANAKHLRVLERIHIHFNNQGWTMAAERLEKCKGVGPVVVEAVADAMAAGTPPATAAGGDPEPTRSTVMRAAMFLVRYGRMSLHEVLDMKPDVMFLAAEKLGQLIAEEHNTSKLDADYLGPTSRKYEMVFDGSAVAGAALASGKARADAELTREAKREFAEHIIVTDGIRDAAARTTPSELVAIMPPPEPAE